MAPRAFPFSRSERQSGREQRSKAIPSGMAFDRCCALPHSPRATSDSQASPADLPIETASAESTTCPRPPKHRGKPCLPVRTAELDRSHRRHPRHISIRRHKAVVHSQAELTPSRPVFAHKFLSPWKLARLLRASRPGNQSALISKQPIHERVKISRAALHLPILENLDHRLHAGLRLSWRIARMR
jgi:hypothetical protein